MAEAGGIDRKAEERMEFNTSKEVTVHPTFESMSLKGKALFALRTLPGQQTLIQLCRISPSWNLRLRLRVALGCSVPRHRPSLQGP